MKTHLAYKRESSRSQEKVMQLTDEESKAVQVGLDDIANGRIFTSEEADAILKKWLTTGKITK
jgi:predicted transcriptional regulator